jgi:hypothetical protein
MADKTADVFEKNYQEYLTQLSSVDLEVIRDTLGLILDSGKLFLPFFNKRYCVTNIDIVDESGKEPSYAEGVVLFKYILLCPDKPYFDREWSAFKDFKKVSHFTNVNFFRSDTEKVIENAFSGRLDMLRKACLALGGVNHEMETQYDLAMKFDALPRISLLLLFNDGDEEFPAKCTVLFQKNAEHYLDPESLAITSAWLAKKLATQNNN